MTARTSLLLPLTAVLSLVHAAAGAPADHAPRACGTALTPTDVELALERAADGTYDEPPALQGQTWFVPLTLHVVRRTNGTGGLTVPQLEQTIADANAAFADAGIVLCATDQVHYIDSDAFYTGVDTMAEINMLRLTGTVPGTMNIWFVDSFSVSGLALCGISSFSGGGTQGIIMANPCTAAGDNPSTLAHEIGHYFDLYHTHETAFGVECANGTNCYTAGDLICDTAADPQLGPSNVSEACQYVGLPTTDCAGDTAFYDPPVHNYMSYSRKHCRSSFSPTQIIRMRTALATVRSELALVTCPTTDFDPTPGLTRASASTAGAQGDGTSTDVAVAHDGRFVAFASDATNLVDGLVLPPGQIYLRDLYTGLVSLVSTSESGAPADAPCEGPGVSADGRYVIFSSPATNLVPDDVNTFSDVFRVDRATGAVELVTVGLGGLPADGWSIFASITADGETVAFRSTAENLVAGDSNLKGDIFVRDMLLGETTRVSDATSGEQGNGHSFVPAISADGSTVVFGSASTNLDERDTNTWGDVYAHDRASGETTLVGIGPEGGIASMGTSSATVSADGRYVAFQNWGTGLLPDDENGSYIDILVADRVTGGLVIASRNDDGDVADDKSWEPSISADGRRVAFASLAGNFDPLAEPDEWDVFVRDLDAGTIELVTVGAASSASDGDANVARLSGDARVVVFSSTGTNLVPFDTNGLEDVFVLEREPALPGDLDADGSIGFADLTAMLGSWGPCPACPADLTGDGSVGMADLTTLLADWE